jgi:aspartyl-tRNA(Asn)/glutamyl-tRNA(Gln) amidotransferase subunit B
MLLLCLHRRAQLFTGTLKTARAGCRTQCPRPGPKNFKRSFVANTVCFQTSNVVPLRKQLKDEAKAKKSASSEMRGKTKKQDIDPRLKNWELTVGIEIHAQLNTARKLFSCTCKRVKM